MFHPQPLRRGHCLSPLLVILAIMSARADRRSASETPTLVPIYAELVGALNARTLNLGSPLLLKIKDPWQNGDCKLGRGSILKGRVVDLQLFSKQDNISRVAVVVDEAECNGAAFVPMPLAVAAILSPDPSEFKNVQQYLPLSASPTVMASGSGTGDSQTRSAGLSGRPASAGPSDAAVFFAKSSDTPINSSKRISLGDVSGISGLKLSVGTGPEQSSVLSMKGHNVNLQRYTQVVLVPAALIARRVAPAPADPASAASAPGLAAHLAKSVASDAEVRTNAQPRPPERDVAAETDVCVPPSCNIVQPDPATTAELRAQKNFPLHDLGYAPRSGAEMEDFDHEAALAYLGQHQLLVTFNPHKLIDRNDAGNAVRMVRAVLLDTSAMRVLRTVDWHIVDRNQYLWPAGEDRILAHVGNELRVYGPGLDIERRIELQGSLAWVRVSPSQQNFAIGVMLERHSKELHAQLAANEEPEEDMEIRVLDAEFQTTATAIRSSRFMPPVLTNEGEVGVYPQKNARWHLVENTWDRPVRSIAYITSACMPQISSVSPDLLFVVTCGRNAGGKYRVLRRDGSLVLQGDLSSKEVQQGAYGTQLGNAFAVGISEADRTIVRGGYFLASDFKKEHLAVYRATDGKRVFTALIDAPLSTREVYALAPGASELAVLSSHQLSLYRIPPQ